MTLDTAIVAITPCDAHDLFAKCRELLGAGPTVPIEDKPRGWNGDRPDQWCISHPPDQGLNAWLMAYYRPGLEPWCTPEEAAKCDKWCEPDCDKTDHRQACWVQVSFDTTYSYRGPNGEGCGDLHARYIFELGQWFDERHIGWGWNNEFTGEWHYEDKYKALRELCTDGGQAMEWFTEIVQPLIEEAVR